MKIKLIPALCMMLFLSMTTDTLTGRWESKPSAAGNITGVVYKADNSFEGYVNKKPFVSGIYTLKDSIMSFVDNGCDGMRAEYVIRLFSNGDSLRFILVSDSCEGRRNGMSRLVLGRVK